MLKLVVIIMMKKNLKYLPHKMLINDKGKNYDI